VALGERKGIPPVKKLSSTSIGDMVHLENGL